MGVSILSIVPNVPMNNQRFLQGFFIAEVGHEFKLFPDIFSNFGEPEILGPRTESANFADSLCRL